MSLSAKIKEGQSVIVSRDLPETVQLFGPNCPPIKKGTKAVVQRIDKDDGTVYIRVSDGVERWVKMGDLVAVEVKKRTKMKMSDIALHGDARHQIEGAIAQHQNRKLIFETWGFGNVIEKGTAVSLLFYGPPGTGKTLAAQAIADTLGLELVVHPASEIHNSYYGQSEKNVRNIFTGSEKSVILLDECDSFLGDRSRVWQGAVAEINEMLMCMEEFEGIIIFTTNRLMALDPAVERRISAKVEFGMPDRTMRLKIWNRLVPKSAPLAADVNFEHLAEFPIPGGNIKNIVLSAARQAAYRGKKKIDMECFTFALEKEITALKKFEAAHKAAEKLPLPDAAGGFMKTPELQ